MPAQPNDKLRNTPSNASVPDEEEENGADDASFSPYSEEMPEYGNGAQPEEQDDRDVQMRAEQVAAQEAAAAAELEAARNRQRIQQIESEEEESEEYSEADNTSAVQAYAKQRAKEELKKTIKRRVMMYIMGAVLAILPYVLIIGLIVFCVIFLSILVENAANEVSAVPGNIVDAITPAGGSGVTSDDAADSFNAPAPGF